MAKLLQKLFSDQPFYVTIPDVDIKSLKSLHTLFDKYLDHLLVKLEQNRVLRNMQNLELLNRKWLTIFENVLTPLGRCFCDTNNC